MRYRTALWIAVAAMLVLPVSSGQRAPAGSQAAPRSRADAVQAVDSIQESLAAMNSSHESYRQAAQDLARMYSGLNGKAQQLARAANAMKAGKCDPASLAALQQAVQQLQQVEADSSLQFQEVQTQMQTAEREYATVSNLAKARTDASKNAINNMR